MIANHIQLLQCVDGLRQFVIPILQRDYSWGTKQCDPLWDDMMRAGRDAQAKERFLGSVDVPPRCHVHLASPTRPSDGAHPPLST